MRGPWDIFHLTDAVIFAIAIRSIFLKDGRGFVQSGAGIVSDSVAEHEFQRDRAQGKGDAAGINGRHQVEIF